MIHQRHHKRSRRQKFGSLRPLLLFPRDVTGTAPQDPGEAQSRAGGGIHAKVYRHAPRGGKVVGDDRCLVSCACESRTITIGEGSRCLDEKDSRHTHRPADTIGRNTFNADDFHLHAPKPDAAQAQLPLMIFRHARGMAVSAAGTDTTRR